MAQTPPKPGAAPTPPPASAPPEKPARTPAHPDEGFLGMVLNKVGLRGLFYQLGGRKTVFGGGALGVITLIVQSDMSDWPKAICCASAAVIAVGLMFSVSSEDKGKK